MALLKSLFPFSFGAKDVAALVIKCIVYLVVGLVAGALIGILAAVPIVGWIVGIFGGLVDIYVLAGIVIAVLDYLKILK